MLRAYLVRLPGDPRMFPVNQAAGEAGEVRGNPVQDRNCPAAVSGNDRHQEHWGDEPWEAMASRYPPATAGASAAGDAGHGAPTTGRPASPKTCQVPAELRGHRPRRLEGGHP